MKLAHARTLLIALCVLGLAAGCAPKRKPVTDRDRKEAALLASEARFAVAVRDWARAEELLAKATRLAPEADYWIGLAAMRVRQGNRAGAKDAYQSALRVFEDDAARDGTRADAWLQQVRVLALMGKTDDCRALLTKAAKRFPDDTRVKALLDPKQFEQMISAPGFKEVAL